MYISGTSKSVILGTLNNQYQVLLWNLTNELDKVEEIAR
jgi:hypothetical protein